MTYHDKTQCRVCWKLEPEIKIALAAGRPRAKNICTSCRAAKMRMQRLERRQPGTPIPNERERSPEEIINEHNLAQLRKAWSGRYYLSVGCDLTNPRYDAGVISLYPDRNQIILTTRLDGFVFCPGPYDLNKVAEYLADRHLLITSRPAPAAVADEFEQAKAEAAESLEWTTIPIIR